MRLLLLSDIHGNLTALQAVLNDIESVHYHADAYCLLGDIVNYGPRPNEVIKCLRQLTRPVMVNIWGNHEYSVFGGDTARFATDRGRSALRYTQKILSTTSIDYLKGNVNNEGKCDKIIEGKHVLFVHGTLGDAYWGKMDLNEMQNPVYADYDYIISGHTHIPQYVEYFNTADKPEYRNKKRTVFINPGSVGQPRNHNPQAQYGILDTATEEYVHRSVEYDIEAERRLYPIEIDEFYKNRLLLGI